MRLLDTTSLEFHVAEHSTFCQEGYAVLSHRWVPEEIRFDQLGSHVEELKSGVSPLSPQLEKIRGSCEIARIRGLKWMWIDSCCIDKRDMVETTESINAMCKWYNNSALCIVYLYDVKKNDATDITDPHIFDRLGQEKPSEWFSRGWTLQELLAPRQVEFYDKEWTYLGTKKEMKTSIGNVTGIDEIYLTGLEDFRRACIAQKMSWMAGRTTTKEEDIAYSMVGLFEINMTPVYGEGSLRAFKRLQEVLLSSRFMDESLFAWKMAVPNAVDDNISRFRSNADVWGLLAPSPAWFAGSADIRTVGDLSPRQGSFTIKPTGVEGPVGRTPCTAKVMGWYFMAYVGGVLGILPGIVPYLYTRHLIKKISNEDYIFRLNCMEVDASGKYKQVGIYLRPMVRVEKLHHFTMFASITHFIRIRCTEFGRGPMTVTENVMGSVRQPILE